MMLFLAVRILARTFLGLGVFYNEVKTHAECVGARKLYSERSAGAGEDSW